MYGTMHQNILRDIFKTDCFAHDVNNDRSNDESVENSSVDEAIDEKSQSKLRSGSAENEFISSFFHKSSERLRNMPQAERILLQDAIVHSWSTFIPTDAYQRMGIPDKFWRLCTVNSSYEICPTYPSLIVVPTSISDAVILGSAKFRSKGRLPALCWRNNKTLVCICRCAQPLVGLTYNRSADDEQFVQTINATNQSSKPLIIVDARPKLNAQANQAVGKGFELERNYPNCKIVFMGIANIHVIRKALESIVALCGTRSSDKVSWFRGIESSGWLLHINTILTATVRMAHWSAIDGYNLLVHCSDGWDRTPQVANNMCLHISI
jgi:myotubularin-related protein 6/7/8